MATRKTNNKNNKNKINKVNKTIKSNVITFNDIDKYFERKNGNFTEKDIILINTFNDWIEHNDELARDGSLSSLDNLQSLDDNDF